MVWSFLNHTKGKENKVSQKTETRILIKSCSFSSSIPESAESSTHVTSRNCITRMK